MTPVKSCITCASMQDEQVLLHIFISYTLITLTVSVVPIDSMVTARPAVT